jgi:mannose-6-phosphate isomerase-like protein (cupin superfamily)
MKQKEIYFEKNPQFLDGNIEKIAKQNRFFRRVMYTGRHSQLVLMSIPPGEEIGEEVHAGTDQIFVIVEGDGEAFLNGQAQRAHEDDVIFVTAGTRHNIRNTDDEDLKLFTIYAPPMYTDATVHKTREEAMQGQHA